MTPPRFLPTRLASVLCLALFLSACGGSDDNNDSSNPAVPQPQPEQPGKPTAPTAQTLRFGVLPDTQGSDSGVALHTMRAALDFFVAQKVEVVLPIGDLVENGTQAEYVAWRKLAQEYRNKLVFLPIMGNHDIKGTDQDWYDYVGDFIPTDAEHMTGTEMKNYAWVRGNVLFINISYGWLERAYDFVEAMVQKHQGKVDHIILQTHNSFVGNRYGLVRENIIDGSHALINDILFREAYDKYRKLFTEHDVIYLSGHEHHYSRSVIQDDQARRFLQIIAGNAAYKGYENRFGEHEAVQNLLMLKTQSMDAGALDLTAPIFDVKDGVIDYQAWYTSHTVTSNDGGPGELAKPSWTVMDRFVRSADRCEKVVFPSSLPAGMQPNGVHDASYRTSACVSAQGSSARILDGINNLFNRHDTRTRTMSATPGSSFATSNTEMLAMMYRYLFIAHANYRPNVNNSQRARLINEGTPNEAVQVRETTIDLKKLLALNWYGKEDNTLSEVLSISGIAAQDGIYTDPWGRLKNMATETGKAGSYGDGSEQGKRPVVLPAYAGNSWKLDDAKHGDPYVLSFVVPEGATAATSALARYDTASKSWKPLTETKCISRAAYQSSYLSGMPADVDAGCASQTIMGYDSQSNAFWARLDQDGAYAIVARQ